jgi:branched-chain amino acid transport system substrate-binding protein
MTFCRSNAFRFLLAALIVSPFTLRLWAQSDAPSTRPYAAMDRESVSYQGPGRGSSSDLRGDTINIGIVLPLQGSRAQQGKLLLQAAQIAVDEANAKGTALGEKPFALVIEMESEQWGQASSAIVRLITESEAVAVITSTDGSIAHQAEQIANKLGTPVLTLSSDPSSTRINIPWIFRVGPSDADQARAIAADIFRSSSSRKILVVAETGHDGRVGADEFVRTVIALGATPPERTEVNGVADTMTEMVKEIAARKPDAIAIWSGPELEGKLLPSLQSIDPTVAIYLCQKAANFLPQSAGGEMPLKLMTVVARTDGKPREGFVERYRELAGVEPGIAAGQTYDAVISIVGAVGEVGANRTRVRDYLASKGSYGSPVRAISFDPAGNSQQEITVVNVRTLMAPESAPGQKQGSFD